MSRNRIYTVSLNPDRVLPIAALVRAPSASAALRHVARRSLDCDVASQNDLVDLISRGVKVEDAHENEQAPASGNSPESAEAPDHVAPSGGESGQPHSASCATATARRAGSPAPAEESGRPIPRFLDRRTWPGAHHV